MLRTILTGGSTLQHSRMQNTERLRMRCMRMWVLPDCRKGMQANRARMPAI